MLIRGLLACHSNLFSYIILNKSASREVSPFGGGGKIREEWHPLFKDFPNRFMISTDLKPSKRAIHKDSDRITKLTTMFLRKLSKEPVKKLATKYAKRMFKLWPDDQMLSGCWCKLCPSRFDLQSDGTVIGTHLFVDIGNVGDVIQYLIINKEIVDSPPDVTFP